MLAYVTLITGSSRQAERLAPALAYSRARYPPAPPADTPSAGQHEAGYSVASLPFLGVPRAVEPLPRPISDKNTWVVLAWRGCK
jgi:hypothetical protein